MPNTYNKAHSSTVAWSCYNWLATQDGARSRAQILAGAQAMWDADLTPAACNAALDEAVRRGLLSEDAAGMLDLKDPQRRYLISRTRGDDPWAGWRAGPRTQSVTVPIADILKGK